MPSPALHLCDESGVDEHGGRGGGDALIAIAVQGRASEIAEWRRLLSNARGLAETSFFFLAYDGGSGGAALAEADCGGDGGACWAPAARTTWTEGRNLLAARMLAAEAARGSRFRYWLFADSDARLERCECLAAESPLAPALAEADVAAAQWRCCFEPLLDLLRSAFEPATLSWGYASGGAPSGAVVAALRAQHVAPDGSMTAFALRQLDCADARLQAFHRDAAPLLLPYFTELDASSWWSSQGILQHLTAGCLAGANYELFVDRNKSTLENQEHAQYPRGRVPSVIDAEARILNASLPALWPWPVPLSTNARGPVACQHERLRYAAVAVSTADGAGADSWRQTPAFEACAAATLARFCRLREYPA